MAEPRNGIEAVSEIVVVTREPVKSADLYIKLLGTSLVQKSLGKSGDPWGEAV